VFVVESSWTLGCTFWIGLQPLSRLEAGVLFRLAGYRYQRGSMMITTNKSVKNWPEIPAGDEVMTTALLDRLLHKGHVLNIRERSHRLRELERVLEQPRRLEGARFGSACRTTSAGGASKETPTR